MTTNHPPPQGNKVYNQAISAYQKSQSFTLTPLEIVVEIYKILMENLMSARLCLSEKKIEQMFFHQKKCIKVISTLANHLDFDAAPEQAEFLDRVYKTIMMRLSTILANKEPVAEIDRIIEFITPVYKRWQELAKDERAALNKKPPAPEGGGPPPVDHQPLENTSA